MITINTLNRSLGKSKSENFLSNCDNYLKEKGYGFFERREWRNHLSTTFSSSLERYLNGEKIAFSGSEGTAQMQEYLQKAFEKIEGDKDLYKQLAERRMVYDAKVSQREAEILDMRNEKNRELNKRYSTFLNSPL